jgi:RNA polymerase sigma-70 factor (ECF subfamily)
VIALNRATAVARARGPEAGLEAVAQIEKRQALQDYYLYYAVLAEFYFEAKEYGHAEENYRHALSRTNLTAERNFLQDRLVRCQTERRGGPPVEKGLDRGFDNE